ncbi:MAG TPA: hypothetical protein VFN48_08340 [Solirubrobacteraceae bacterium]|nr:hypothetical protein [Solirubrobacteraceae bacterium]
MDLTRSWARQVFGASGVALLLPAALMGVVVAVGLAGGFAGLDSVRELVAGPTLSSPSTSASLSGQSADLASGLRAGGDGRPASAAASLLPPVLPGVPGVGSGGPATETSAGGRSGSHHLAGGGRASGTAPTGRHHRHPGGGAPARGSGTPAPAPGSSPGPRPLPPTPSGVTGALAAAVRGTATTVSRASSVVAGGVARLPGPVGRTAAGTVTSVGATAATLLDSVANGLTRPGAHSGGSSAPLAVGSLPGP